MKREMKEMFRDVQRQGKEKGGCDNMRATKEYRLKVTEEAQKIVDQLTLEQKVSLMSGSIVDLNKVTQEQIMEMMGGMLSDDNHYNMTPYPAGDWRNITYRRCCL